MKPIEIIFKGVDQTKAATTSVKAGLEGVQTAAKKTGGAFDVAMGVLAANQVQQFGNAVSGFMKDAIREASEAQAGMVQLEQVIKSTGGAAGLTADEISAMATSFSRMTQFEDDAIIAGQTVLLQFTKLGKDVFPQATEAMLNLSARMGIDLPAAAKIVGKALEGEFSGLARFGVVLDDATKKQIENLLKIGDTAGAQALILSELEKRFGGAAEAAGNTSAGSVERLNNALGDFKETVGNALVQNESFKGLIDSLVNLINSLADAFVKLPGPVQTGIVAFVGLIAVAAKLAPALITLKILFGAGGLAGAAAALKGALVGLVTIIAGISLPVLALIAAIGALIATIVIFGKDAWKTITMISTIWNALIRRMIFETFNFVNNIARAFVRAFTLARQAGANIVQGIWAGIQGAWSTLLSNVSTALNNLLTWIQNAIGAHSPATKFKPIGISMAQAVGIGWKEGLQKLAMPTIGASLQPAPAYARAGAPAMGGGGATITGNTFAFYSPLTHDERHRIRKEQTEAAQREVLRSLR